MTPTTYVCLSCGEKTGEEICPNCDEETTPEDSIPTRCLDCNAELTVAPHLRTSLGQCETCANENPTIIGLRAWDDLF
jgi:predicted amidophosphoribosyltransferase